MPVITLDRRVEETIQTAIQHRERGSYLALDPRIAQKILDSLSGLVACLSPAVSSLYSWSSPQIRPHVRRLTERYFPSLAVLSHNEITSQVRIQSIGTVTIDAS